MKNPQKYRISETKTKRPVKKGIREFDDLRDAVMSMEEHNSRFYFQPNINDFKQLDFATVNKIEKMDCWCGDYLTQREKFRSTLEIRYTCKHTALKLVELPLHPVIKSILLNKSKHGKERFVMLSEVEPIILGFTSLAKLRWINVYHYDIERDLAIRFSYSPFENKWSYGKLPPDGREVEYKIKNLLQETLMMNEF